jgi:predicted FMN-binding regulatory protein PaiB
MKLQAVDFTLNIEGMVENIDDCKQISKNVKELAKQNDNKVVIVFKDSFVIPSTLIGQMLKLIQVDKIAIHIKANNDLFALLERLNLIKTFNVSKL